MPRAGRNEAGKSTALKTMLGLLAPSSGEVALNGVSVRAKRLLACRWLGFCPQEPLLWEDLTVEDHLRHVRILLVLDTPRRARVKNNPKFGRHRQ